MEHKITEYIHQNTGPNRRERRHGRSRLTGKHYIIPEEYREPATNEPYRKSDEDNMDSPDE